MVHLLHLSTCRDGLDFLFFVTGFTVWKVTGLPLPFITNPTIAFDDKLSMVLDIHENSKFNIELRMLAPLTLWRLWKNRNLLIF